MRFHLLFSKIADHANTHIVFSLIYFFLPSVFHLRDLPYAHRQARIPVLVLRWLGCIVCIISSARCLQHDIAHLNLQGVRFYINRFLLHCQIARSIIVCCGSSRVMGANWQGNGSLLNRHTQTTCQLLIERYVRLKTAQKRLRICQICPFAIQYP